MPETNDDIIQEALSRFQLVAEAESDSRAKCLDDLKFSTGDQWPQDIRNLRQRRGQACLTMDQTQQSIRIVCNEYRQRRPAIEVNPVGNDSDVETAEIFQGSIRHIEVQSDAEVAYDNAHESVVRIGVGSWRLLSDYAEDDSGEQEIYIKKIRNQFTVYWQPGVEQEDAKWAFIVQDVPLDTYKADYKDSTLASLELSSIGDAPQGWVTKEDIRVAEYFTVEEIKQEGKKTKKKVIWRKINAREVLEGPTTLPGSSIPILTAYGDDIDVDGVRYLAGLMRNAKDPQRMYNYWTSAATQKIALARTAPWIVAEGQLAGKETQWENDETSKVLTYKQTDVGGNPAPPPQRQLLDAQVDSMALMTRQAAGDVKAAMGVYDPSLGQRKGDESGKAIEHLQQQGSLATMNYADNIARTMRRCGKLLIEWIQELWDVPKIRRIIKTDGTVSHVITHNGPDQRSAAEKLQTDQIKKIYDIGVGRYDVTVSVGPNYQTKRQEAVATQLDLLQKVPPQMAQNILDLVIRNMDIPQANEMADRIKRMIPPQIVGGDDDDPQVQMQKMQSTLQEMGKQHELLTKALQDAQKVIETKQIEQQAKVQMVQTQELSKQTIVKMQEVTKLAVAQINASKDAHQQYADAELQQFDLMHSAAHDVALQAHDQAHQQNMAAQGQAADQQAQQSDQEHQAEMATVNQGEE